jgi:hypothetical protein
MEDILVVEKEDKVFHVKSNGDRFSPQTCAPERNALLRQLVPYGVPQEEVGKIWTQLQKTDRAEIQVSLPVAISKL